MKKAIQTVLVLVVLALIVGGGYWYYQTRLAAPASESGIHTQIVAVRKGNLNSTVSVVGQLEAVQQADLAFEHLSDTTPLATLAVQPGNTVKAGQVLASVDPAPYQQVLDQAQSDLQASEEALAALKKPATELQIAQADLAVAQARYQLQAAEDALDTLVHPDIPTLEAAVADAKSAVEQAQADILASQQDTAAKDQLARLRTAEATPTALYNRLAAEKYSDSYYQDRLELAYNKMMDAQDPRVTNEVQAQVSALQAQMSLRQSQQTQADAEAALVAAESGGDKLGLAQAQVAVQEAQVGLLAAQDARQQLDAGAEATALTAAQADVDKKRLVVAEAQAALAGTQLVAPFAGTVLAVPVAVGDQIGTGTVIVTLADLEQLQVVAAVDETMIQRVAAGQDVVISFDAFPGQVFRGQVLGVPLQGTLQGGVTVYDVPMSLTGAEALPLLVGMTANVQVAQVADAVLVPTIALQRSGGGYQVLVPSRVESGVPEAVRVEVGLSDGVYTQVTRGLAAGDQVVVEVDASQATNNPFARSSQGGLNQIMNSIRQFSRPGGR